ncbi:MAG: hypothetical protein WBF71_01380 [Microthrixaceae bacterium]
MRTTLNIEEAVLKEARRRARARGVSLGKVFEDALRLAPTASRVAESIELPIFEGDGLRPGVDLSSSRSIEEFLDSGRELDQLR